MTNRVKEAVSDTIEFLKKHGSRDHPDYAYYILILVSFVIFVIGTNLFVEFSADVSGKALNKFDDRITEFITSFRTPELNNFFQFVTDLGDVYAYLIATTIAAAFFFFKLRNKRFIFQLLAVIIISGLANIALKRAFDRARPDLEHLVVVKTLSYPSGHAMSAMAFYGFLIYLVFHIKMHKLLRLFLVTLFSALIFFIGISRIYLGVHFPSDVVGGFIAGLIWVAFCIILFNIIALLRERKRRFNGSLDVEENLEV
ncbi:phosphatase PAP2 family protein [Salinimicrobium flavum]|uniref:Phosphatase PAP2 family protein n=1 Tax=Salinimicrobium flavum TaxID=1737065 RepID=A0ABW5J050_9FLAO